MPTSRVETLTSKPPGKMGKTPGCSFLGRLQTGVGYTVRRYPSTVLVPLTVFLSLAAIGIGMVMLASNSAISTSQNQAALDAAATAQLITESIQALIQPTFSMAMCIRANPYYPDVERTFSSLTKTLLDQVQLMSAAGSAGPYLQLGPMANILQVYPVNEESSMSVGLDLLDDPALILFISQPPEHRLILQGPVMLYREKVWGMIGAIPIFVPNVAPNATFGFPASLPTECPEGLAPLCYDEGTGSKFWGMIWSVMYFSSFISGSSAALHSLRDKGYSYMLTTAPDVDDPPLTPGFTAPDGSAATLLSRSPEDLMPDAQAVVIEVLGVGLFKPWTLMVAKTSGWVPAWRNPLLATVVILAAIIAILLFVLLLYMRQHQSLLYALMPRNMVQSLFQADAFEAIVKNQGSMRPDEPRMLNSGTPVERLIDVLSQIMMGKDPNMQEVIALRAAVIQGGDMLFEPQNLRGQLQCNTDLEDDVVDALVRELQGLTYSQAPGGVSRGNTGRPALLDKQSYMLRPGSSCSIPDDDALGRLSVALNFITNDPGNEHHPAGGGGILSSLPSLDIALLLAAGQSSNGRSIRPRRELTLLPASKAKGTSLKPAPAPTVLSPPCLPSHPSDNEAELMVTNPNDLECDVDPAGRCSSMSAQAQAPPLIHVQCLVNDPQAAPANQVERLLEAAYGSWTFNAFELAEATNGHPLSAMLFFLLSRSGLIRDMNLSGSTVARLSLAIEDGYHSNPYHNKTHAADVLQTMHAILLNSGMVVAEGQKGYCPPLTLLACFLAAAGHDIGHTGVTNDFLIHSEDQLSTVYSDKSPMEHHHLARLWALLRNPSYNIMRNFKREERAKVRKTVIDLICATDMKSHFSILSQFSISHRLSGVTGPAAAAAATTPTGSSSGMDSETAGGPPKAAAVPTDDAEQLISLQVVLKCADLGHIAESLKVHRRWVGCLEEEFFSQGDRERSLGIPISPLFDRNKPGVSKSQIGFYDFVVLPLFHNFSCAFPGAKPMVDLALNTYKFWKSISPAADP